MTTYHDFWLNIERRGNELWVTSRSPAGEHEGRLTLPDDLSTYHLSALLQASKGSSRGATAEAQRDAAFEGDDAPPQRLAEDVGYELYRALFSGPIRDALSESRGIVGKEGGLRFRLQTNLNDPELAEIASLPWELIYARGRREALGRSKLTPVVRYLNVPQRYETVPLDGALRVLLVLAEPNDEAPLDLEQEKDGIEQKLASLDNVEVEVLEHATRDSLLDKLDTGDYHVLHFMGHGGFHPNHGGVLFLEDEDGHGVPLSGAMLGEALRPMRSMRLVFLNACDTGRTSHEPGRDPFAGVAAALVIAGLPAVVAMQVPIADRAALEFAEKFYTLIAHREPVDAAVSVGRQAIHRTNPSSLEWATPVLFMRAPDGDLFDPKPPPLPAEPPPEKEDAPPPDPRTRQLQRALIEKGYEPGPPDGVFGARTRAALTAFQRDTGLPADGKPSPETLSKLGLAKPKPPDPPPEKPEKKKGTAMWKVVAWVFLGLLALAVLVDEFVGFDDPYLDDVFVEDPVQVEPDLSAEPLPTGDAAISPEVQQLMAAAGLGNLTGAAALELGSVAASVIDARQRHHGQGFQTVAEPLFLLGSGGTYQYAFTAAPGVEYHLQGACDTNCGGISLGVYAPNGALVSGGDGLAEVVVPATSFNTQYNVGVLMNDCFTSQCYAGFGVYGR